MTVDLSSAFRILLDSGTEVIAGDGDRVFLRTHGSRTLRYRLVVGARVTDEARIRADLVTVGRGHQLLYIVERATDALRLAAARGDIAYVAVRDGCCSVAGHAWPEHRAYPARPHFTLWALARVLLSRATPILQGTPAGRAPRTGAEPSLQSILGVSQPHVSALLRQLPVKPRGVV